FQARYIFSGTNGPVLGIKTPAACIIEYKAIEVIFLTTIKDLTADISLENLPGMIFIIENIRYTQHPVFRRKIGHRPGTHFGHAHAAYLDEFQNFPFRA